MTAYIYGSLRTALSCMSKWSTGHFGLTQLPLKAKSPGSSPGNATINLPYNQQLTGSR